MCVEVLEVRVGEPLRCGALTVFPLYPGLPLFPEGDGTCHYALAHEAMAAGTLIIREVSEVGSVCSLIAENLGDLPVFLPEGLELKGAKQNRGLVMSVLLAGKSSTRIPVCCVQRKRWTYTSRQFSPGGCCPPSLRLLFKQGGHGNIVPGGLRRQEAVWQEIRRKHRATATSSSQENLTDTLDTHRERAEDLRDKLPCPEGASGIVVTVNGRAVCLDVFDKPATLVKLWDRLTQGLTLDALEYGDMNCQADVTSLSVEPYKRMLWWQVESVGLGETYRATGDDGTLASALVLDDTPIHVSISMPTMG